MNHQRGDVGTLIGGFTVLIGIAVGISFVLIAQHYSNKRVQSVLKTMDNFPPPPPPKKPKRHPDPKFTLVS
jgi:hypothetical protein